QAILDKALQEGKSYLAEFEASEVLAAYGLPVVPSKLVTTAENAEKAAHTVGFPLVMKVMSADVVHKSDAGGVILNINSPEEAAQAFKQIIDNVKKYQPDAKIEGILMRQMIPDGEEVILGLKRDVSFGGVVMFGLGGIFVEVVKDIAFRVAPLSKEESADMIKDIKGAPLLFGMRNQPARDVTALQESIQRLSQLAEECPQIKELDINPMIVLEENKGAFIADARIIL
ncbi:CoA-binding protein, partial [candidate division KSB1 bacterium]